MEQFDFDAWAALAKTSPGVFEQQRQGAVESIISTGNNVRRLCGLQCRIDLERARARTPMKACLRLCTLMWDAFLECRAELNTLVHTGTSSAKRLAHPASAQSAKVLPFLRKN
jgi:hypothetical protein